MPASTLFPGEKVYTEKDCEAFEAKLDRTQEHPFIIQNGEKRLMARMPPLPSAQPGGYSLPYADSGIELIDKANLDAAIDDQIDRGARVSDYIDFDQLTQNGLPTCWAICMAQSMMIKRRVMGLPNVTLSGCSLAVPISGGHSGGYEGDSYQYSYDHGVCSTAVWPENQTRGIDNNSPEVQADRKLHKSLKMIQMDGDQQWWSALLRTLNGPFAYDWMSHCMSMCDFVRIEAGSYGYRVRNTWFPWGAKNPKGFDGFAVYPMGRRGTPSSGLILLDIIPSEK